MKAIFPPVVNKLVAALAGVKVNLVSFAAQLIDSKTSSITWKTECERNNDQFEIERSVNDTNNWQKRGSVKSIGNSVLPTNYLFTDSLPFVSNVKVKFYYRLKQTDFDGKFRLTKIKKGDKVLVSYIGYNSVTVPYTGQNDITVSLEESSNQLQEVVIQVGYGTAKKKDAT